MLTFWRVICSAILLSCISPSLAAASFDLGDLNTEPCRALGSRSGNRAVAVISDLHFGLGKGPDGRWDPTEDFRWPAALESFLDKISGCGKDNVDLVIAGDLLDLWQPPAELLCEGPDADHGCTPEEATAITRAIVKAHDNEFRALGRFASKGSNRLYVLPGNHDAALTLDGPWALVRGAIPADRGRVIRVRSGIWRSADNAMIVEHGQQIGRDANRYEHWPEVTESRGGTDYLVRPWGELFVQKLFNDVEREYPIIDNLGPESAGLRYRSADRGSWKTISDVGRFLKFNLLETSLSQISDVLGKENNGRPPEWDVKQGRSKGHLLFAHALPDSDPFRVELLGDSREASDLRKSLDVMAADNSMLSDSEVLTLCEQMAIRSGGKQTCATADLGAPVEKYLVSRRYVMRDHLQRRIEEAGLGGMTVFVYGHTHELESSWTVRMKDDREVSVLNTGAFQRVVDERGFLARARAKNIQPNQALRTLEPEDLPACYTAAIAIQGEMVKNSPRVIRWAITEGGQGRFVGVDDSACK